jgi:recombination protein RecT
MATGNSLTKKQEGNTFSTFLTSDAVKQKINQIVGGKDGQRFMTAIISAVSNNPLIADCEHASILSAALIGESLKLSPSAQLGQYYIVPFNDRKNQRKVAQFQIGYKGYLQLAIRSGQYKKINVIAIKTGELVHYDPLNEELEVNLIQDDETREASETVGYYAMFEYLNGFRKCMYWSKKKMEFHAKYYSQAYKKDLKEGTDYSFWTRDFDPMAFKTMLRQIISKWGIMSIEIQQAFEEDKEEVMQAEYVDTTPEQPKERITAKDAFFDDKADQPELVKE